MNGSYFLIVQYLFSIIIALHFIDSILLQVHYHTIIKNTIIIEHGYIGIASEILWCVPQELILDREEMQLVLFTG